jgi:uncharacterized membrane protein (DUF485 family)
VLLLTIAGAINAGLARARARRFQRVAALTIPLAFYLFFLSGGISVIAFLPEWVQTIALVLVGTSAITLGLGIVSLRRSLVA